MGTPARLAMARETTHPWLIKPRGTRESDRLERMVVVRVKVRVGHTKSRHLLTTGQGKSSTEIGWEFVNTSTEHLRTDPLDSPNPTVSICPPTRRTWRALTCTEGLRSERWLELGRTRVSLSFHHRHRCVPFPDTDGLTPRIATNKHRPTTTRATTQCSLHCPCWPTVHLRRTICLHCRCAKRVFVPVRNRVRYCAPSQLSHVWARYVPRTVLCD
jgi:hypothetical protein